MNALQVSSNAVASKINEQQATELFQKLIINSDLSSMTPDQQIEYYKLVCNRVGLDPYQKPFDLIKLSGKLTLYANKTATAQLTSIRNLRVSIVAREVVGDQYVVTARCETQNGGLSEDIGAVPIGKLSGDAVSNAMKKAATQAKRRAILAACGLGMLDEEEVLQVRDAVRVELPPLQAQIVEQQPLLVEEPLNEHQENAIADIMALIDGATTADEMDQIVAILKQSDKAVQSSVKNTLNKKAMKLNLVWINGQYKDKQNGTR
jgi:hypothetical protein